MNTKQLQSQIEAKTAIAEDDLKDATNSTRATREGNKRAAKEALQSLKEEYRNALLREATFVLVTGPQEDELMALSKESSNLFSKPAEEMYEKLADQIPEGAYLNQVVGGSIFNGLNLALQDLAMDIGVKSYPQLHFKSQYARVLKNKEGLVELVKQAINENVGSEMVGVYAVSVLLDTVIASKHQDRFLPILLNTKDTDLVKKLANDLPLVNPNVFVVSVNKGKVDKALKNVKNSLTLKEVTKESVSELLTAIKEKTV